MRVYLDPNDKSLQDKYNELFEKIQQNTGLTVTDLPSYFAALEKVKEGSQQNRFFRIPLDEPCFTINMSTRAIAVPKDFATYGLGVKGDTYAEVVFFESDRFFDQVDLKSAQCWIQWVNTSTQAKGNSQSVYMDATEDKLLFGWVITDEMTTGAGNIEFAVRWFTLNEEGNVSYSVSTQKATCSIKPSLDLDVKALLPDADIENILKLRPKYSGIINSLDGSAAIITTDLVPADYSLEQPTEEETELWTAYQAAGDKLPVALVTTDSQGHKVHDGVYKFTVAAKGPHETGDTITYQWFNGSKQLNGATEASYIAYEAGNYYAKIGCTEQEGGAGTRYINSKTVTVPAAKDIKFGEDYSFPPYAWSYAEPDKNVIFNCSAVDAASGTQANGKINYVFNKQSTLKDDDSSVVAIENNNLPTYKFPTAFEGRIFCTAQNRLNNTVSNKLVSNDCQVRMAPIVLPTPKLAFNGDNTKLIATVSSDDPKWAISMQHTDEFVYSWSVLADNQPFYDNFGSTNLFDLTRLPKATIEGAKKQYTIICAVKHTVQLGSSLVMTSDGSEAGMMTVSIDAAGNIT